MTAMKHENEDMGLFRFRCCNFSKKMLPSVKC